MSLVDEGPLQIGDKFLGKYQILGVIGRGGHGCVYQAVNLYMGRHVAIKVLDGQHAVSEELLYRGQTEAMLLGKLEHENIVRVHDAGVSESGHLYLVMEFLRGKTLRAQVREEGPLGVVRGLEVLEALCLGLEKAHRENAIHRDLKPANIFITEDGAPKILDFGIAKIVGAAGFQTAQNMVVGTCLYMSPEQIQGQPATARSDVYALGLVMYEAFSGHHPILYGQSFGASDRLAVSYAHVKNVPKRLDELLPGFPDYVARLVHTALVKRPGQRFDSAKHMADAARVCRERYLREQGLSKPSSAGRAPFASAAHELSPKQGPVLRVPQAAAAVRGTEARQPGNHAAVAHGSVNDGASTSRFAPASTEPLFAKARNSLEGPPIEDQASLPPPAVLPGSGLDSLSESSSDFSATMEEKMPPMSSETPQLERRPASDTLRDRAAPARAALASKPAPAVPAQAALMRGVGSSQAPRAPARESRPSSATPAPTAIRVAHQKARHSRGSLLVVLGGSVCGLLMGTGFFHFQKRVAVTQGGEVEVESPVSSPVEPSPQKASPARAAKPVSPTQVEASAASAEPAHEVHTPSGNDSQALHPPALGPPLPAEEPPGKASAPVHTAPKAASKAGSGVAPARSAPPAEENRPGSKALFSVRGEDQPTPASSKAPQRDKGESWFK